MFAFVTPSAGWQKPQTFPVAVSHPPPKTQKPGQNNWADFASDQAWEEATIEFLREHRRAPVPYWRVVNSIIAESAQPSRSEVRLATVQLLTTITALLKAGCIMRYRRRFLALLDFGTEVVPLEAYRAMKLRSVERAASR